MRIKKFLGEVLIESKLLTNEQLQKALVEKKNSGLKLGQFLVHKGIVKENDIVDTLSKLLNIQKYTHEQYPIDIGLTELISLDVIQKNQVVPLKRKGRLITVAMTDPLDIKILDCIEGLTNLEVEPVICTEREINQLINSNYGMQSEISDIQETMEIDSAADTNLDKAVDQMTEDVLVSSLRDRADETPVVRLVNSILTRAVREGASDIHISPKKDSVRVRFRVDGRLHEVHPLQRALFLPMVARIKILANIDITIARMPQDGRFTLRMDKKEINVRVSTLPTIYGENVTLRLLDINEGIYTLDRLGMVREDIEKITKMIHQPYGMILSTGPTGSGKSTSLYAILNELNRPDINIITLEDPVEYRVENICQSQLNPKAGMTFASGLRAILRQDPEVIMVGEIRDQETAAIAVKAAQTGHLVLSTLHTNDAAGAITRLMDMGIEPFLISTSLQVSFAQRLVRTNCPYCKEPYQPSEKLLSVWGFEKVENSHFMKGRGCQHCLNTGYKGRTGLFEVLVNDDMVQHMIIKEKSAQEIASAAVEAGRLRTLKQDAALKALQGITSLEEVSSAVLF